MQDVIVVGAGLFGGTIARALRAQGRSVTVIDDSRPMNGSAPSGCLMKPSWFDGLGPNVHKPSLELLDRIYGLRRLQFTIWPIGKQTEVMWVPANERADLEVRALKALAVRPGEVETDGGLLKAKLVIVAAGVWCNELMKVDGLHGKTGCSFLTQSKLDKPVIRAWAPYKQIVAFTKPDTDISWVGDGSAIKPENWTKEREAASAERCAKVFTGDFASVEVRTGIRPMIKGAKPCLLEDRGNGLWLCTGGGKNGTIAAGWAASQLLEVR